MDAVTAGPLGRPGAAELTERLGDPLAALFAPRGRRIDLTPLPFTPRADAPAALRVNDSAGRPLAAILCSAPEAPGMVQRAMSRALEARARLGADAARPILEPLMQGQVRGLSYAVLPWCDSPSTLRPLWWLQRRALRAALLDWLHRVAVATAREPASDDIERRFVAPLRHVAALPAASEPVRHAAAQAIERLARGVWQPRTVLMHGDLWKGNVLLRPAPFGTPRLDWAERLVIIDWAGADLHGHAFYDLVRLSYSLGLPAGTLRAEVARHCAVLGCTPRDAMSSLLAALGQIGLALEHFPPAQYAHMVEQCCATLAPAISS